MNKQNSVRFCAYAAAIAVLYAALTIFTAPISFGAIQFRIAEALCVLAAIIPAAIPGLTLGCLIANCFSFNPIDMLIGTLATLLAALLTYKFKNIKFKGVPYLSFLMPIVFNTLFIGLEIAIFVPSGNAVFTSFIISAVTVGISEAAVIAFIGTPLYFAFKRIFPK